MIIEKKSQLSNIGKTLVGADVERDFDFYRRVLVSPTVNTPEPFEGFGGFCGWPVVQRLRNGDLYVIFSAGYWHASWPTPWSESQGREYAERMFQKLPWARKWHAPQGGRIMWIRSRDNGVTWTRPRPFPVVSGVYGGQFVQLRDGALLAAGVMQFDQGYRHLDGTVLDQAKKLAYVNMKRGLVFFRSDDNGEIWQVISRISGPFTYTGHPQTLMDLPDGSVLLLINGVPWPSGKTWPTREPHYVSAMLRSTDGGFKWDLWSVIGSDDFDVEEGSAALLPDGSIGFASRCSSAWYQSYDNGKTWSCRGRLREGPFDARKTLYKKGDLNVTPDGVAVLVYCSKGEGHNGRVLYSRDSGSTWICPSSDERGFQYDPLSYYPSACVLEDGSIFAVGDHQGFESRLGPYSAESVAMRFRIKSPAEGEGIELLPIGEGGRATFCRDIPEDAAAEADGLMGG